MSGVRFFRHIQAPPQPPKPVLGWSECFFCAMTIAQIAIGAIYLDDCPRQPYIPIYLIVVGVFGLVLAMLFCLLSATKPEDRNSDPIIPVCVAWQLLACLFLFCWFIAGSVWIFSIYQPNYNKNTTNVDPYCDKTVYLFAFWTTIVLYILLGLFLVSGCCVLVCNILCDRYTPDVDIERPTNQ